jgi:hypothetical protein
MSQLVHKTHYSLLSYSDSVEQVLAEVQWSSGRNSPEYKRLKLLSKEFPATLRSSGLRSATQSLATSYLDPLEKYIKQLRRLKTLQVMSGPA